MDCQECDDLLSAYLDDELDPSALSRMNVHLAECATCRDAATQQLSLRQTLRQHATRHVAPARLRQRIQTALQAEMKPDPKLETTLKAKLDTQKPAKAPLRKWHWGWINFAAATAFASAFAVTLSMYLALPSITEQFGQEVVASHYRSLLADHLTDVVSSDRHTVKPWFAGKLDFSPPVFDLVAQGFPLAGGRLDYLDRHAVAALAYRHQQHLLNLFIWPANVGKDLPATAESRQGYQLLHWTRAGMQYWAVSDMSMQELIEFRRLFLLQTDADAKS